jgi:hypothetical protein
MMIELEFRFAHNFECQVLEELPGGRGSQRYFPDYNGSGQDGVILRVQPERGNAWIGVFAYGKFGSSGISRVLGMPA